MRQKAAWIGKPSLVWNWALSGRGSGALSRKPEMHHVAVGDLILLAFQPQLADVARAGLAAGTFPQS